MLSYVGFFTPRYQSSEESTMKPFELPNLRNKPISILSVEKEFVFAQSRRDNEESEILTFALQQGKCHQARQFFEVFTMTNHPQLDLLLDEELELRENGSPAEGKVIHIEPHLGGKIVLVDMGVYKNDDILKYYSYYNRFRVTVTKHPLEQSITLSNLFDVTTREWRLNDLEDVISRAEEHLSLIHI